MNACAHTFHDVTESGTVSSTDALPSAPTRSCGAQNAVSANSLRSSAAAVATGAAVGATPLTASAILRSSASFALATPPTAASETWADMGAAAIISMRPLLNWRMPRPPGPPMP